MTLADVDAALDCPREVTAHYLVAQCDHATLAAAMRAAGVVADALVVDAPYSARTHEGHAAGLVGERSDIDYSTWTEGDAIAFVGAWHALTRGWIVSLTDHVLAPAWERAYLAAYRYAFSPLACVETGSRVRMLGDGPSQWATWAMVARPRTREWATWGTLPGAYVGASAPKAVTGGKPAWLMRALVRDYSRPDDVVCDPCAGGGSTLVAAVELGRLAIGCEPDPERYAVAVKMLTRARRPLPGLIAPRTEQIVMGGLSDE